MHRVVGISLISASAILAMVVALVLRGRLPRRRMLGLVGLAGGGLGLGAMIVQRQVNPAEWVLAPLVCAALVALHASLLFSGSGPFRT